MYVMPQRHSKRHFVPPVKGNPFTDATSKKAAFATDENQRSISGFETISKAGKETE
jgi:hypothetical protein